MKRAAYAAGRAEPCSSEDDFRTGYWIGEHYRLCRAAFSELGLLDVFVPRAPLYKNDGTIAFATDAEGLPPSIGSSTLGVHLLAAIYGGALDNFRRDVEARLAAATDPSEKLMWSMMLGFVTLLAPVDSAKHAEAWAQSPFRYLVDAPHLRTVCEFAELPDFYTSINDYWSEGEAACPPGLAPETCHEFSELSLLNSTHFGEQAAAMYRHYHGLALEFAAQCKAQVESDIVPSMNGLAVSSALPADLPYLGCDATALMYEAVGLHYLQDRWSSGHMWQRWGGPTMASYGSGATAATAKPRAQQVALVSGLIHGADAVLQRIAPGARDAMCAPGNAYRWGFAASDERYPGVGDLYVADLLGDARFAVQRDWLMRCQTASISEVYRAGSGTALGAPSPAPSFDMEHCLAAYATNGAVYDGWGISGKSGSEATHFYAEIANLGWGFGGTMGLLPEFNVAHAQLAIDFLVAKIRHDDGLELARGDWMPSFLGVRPGNAFVQQLPAAHHDESLWGRGSGLDFARAAAARDGSNNFSYVVNQLWGLVPKLKCDAWTQPAIEALRDACVAEYHGAFTMSLIVANAAAGRNACGNCVAGAASRFAWFKQDSRVPSTCDARWGIGELANLPERCFPGEPRCTRQPNACPGVLSGLTSWPSVDYCNDRPTDEGSVRVMLCP